MVNLLTNSGFESDGNDVNPPTGWTDDTGGAWVTNDFHVQEGSYSYGNNWSGNEATSTDYPSADVYPNCQLWQETTDVTAGAEYTASVYLWSPSGSGNGDGSGGQNQYVWEDDGRLRVTAYDSNNEEIGEWETLWMGEETDTNPNTWVFRSLTFTTPSGTAKLRFNIDGGDGNNSVIDKDTGHSGNAGLYMDNTLLEQNVTAPSQPQNVSLAYDSDDQLTLTWDEVSDWGGETGSYDIQISRDETSFVAPASGSGASSVSGGSASYSETYGTSSDDSYYAVVGIDSSFTYRVRATNSAGASSWVNSSAIYTSPVPPHTPTSSRPDSNTVDITITKNSESFSSNNDYLYIQFREDTGSGYGSWTNLDAVSGTDGCWHSGDSWNAKGAVATLRVEADTTYQYGNSFTTDSRVQFRLRDNQVSPNQTGYAQVSDWVYSDYGNRGNVYFEDDFESGDLSAWDATSLQNSWGVVDSTFTDPHASSGDYQDGGRQMPVNDADQGTYYLFADGGGYVQKNLGDLSSESNVIVKLAMSATSMDSSSENIGLLWYNGNSWNNLTRFSHEYNKQGWVEVAASVPSQWLSTDNRLRLEGYGGSGDYGAFDRVIVSDVLDEYTQPAAPTNLSLDPTVAGEITASWTANTGVLGPNLLPSGQYVEYREVGGTYTRHVYNGDSPQTIGNLTESTEYQVQVFDRYAQSRNGSRTFTWNSTAINDVATARLPLGDNLTAMPGAVSADLDWTNNSADMTGQSIHLEVDDEKGFEFTGIGASESIAIPSRSYVPQQFTVEVIVEIDALDVDTNNNYRQILGSSVSNNFILVEQSGSVSFRVPGVDGSNFTAGSIPADGTKHKITCVYDQSDRIIYVDGVEAGRETIGSGTVNFGSIDIGGDNSSQNPDGRVFGLKISPTALTTEITSSVDEFDGTDPYAYYPLDEKNGSITPDMSGYGNHATVSGPTQTVGDREFDFTRSNSEYISLPDLSSYYTDELSITARGTIDAFPSSSSDVSTFISQAFNGDNVTLVIRVESNGNIRAGLFDGNWHYAGSFSVALGDEHTYTAQYNGSTLRLLVDGSVDGSTSYSASLPSDTSPWYIGRRWDLGSETDNYLSGQVDMVQFHSRYITVDENDNISDGGVVSDSLFAYLPLDVEESGETPDISGNGLDGTLNGPTQIGDGFVVEDLVPPTMNTYELLGLTNNTTYEAKVHVHGPNFAGEFR